MAKIKPTKAELKQKKESVQKSLKANGFKMPHGYDIAIRKKVTKK